MFHERKQNMASKGKKKPTLYDLSKEHLKATDVEAFISELKSESDRACALVGAAAIDHELMSLLMHRMRPLAEDGVNDTFYGKDAVLATLSAKAEIAFLFGFITEKEKKMIDIIRKIRNAFAHSSKKLTFENELVEKEVKKLSILKSENAISTKAYFTTAIMAILIRLSENTKELLKEKLRPKTIGDLNFRGLKLPDKD
jgi:hypothetical protein